MNEDQMQCPYCKEVIAKGAIKCRYCGEILDKAGMPGEKRERLVYILLCLFLGIFGVHNFYAGYSGRAIAQLLLTLLSFFILSPIVAIWCLIEVFVVKQDVNGSPFA